MIKSIEVKEGVQLKDYDMYPSLVMSLRELYTESAALIPKIKGKKVWMINSTSMGGGVAEMMPRIISFFRQLGIESEWLVASSEKKEFFRLTKKIHNLIHGEGNTTFSSSEKLIYEQANQENADALYQLIKPGDILVIHDPQPMAIVYFLKDKINFHSIWRCHIGLDYHTKETKAAWDFLKPYAESFDNSVFSATEYVPWYLTGKSLVMHPSIDPLAHKNRDLPIHKVVGILCNSNLVPEYHPVLTPPFTERVKKLQADGSFQSPLLPSDPGLLFKPTITQISRWDNLKGFLPLIKGFEELKKNKEKHSDSLDRQLRRLQLVELVLAGPDPDFVEDDPEGKEVLKDLSDYYMALPASVKNQISILKIPMSSRKNNELIVNALQRATTAIVQNSIKESFGLTVTEAMWKIKPVIGSNAFGIKQQIRDGIDGKIIENPDSPEEIALAINHTLAYPKEREVWSYNAEKKVIEKFLIFTQIRKWIELFSKY